MKKLVKIFAWIFAVFVILIVTAVIVVPILIDSEKLKSQAIKYVKTTYNRDLVIPGELDISVFPKLGLGLGEIEMHNPSGFGEKIFFKANNAKIGIKLLPLLSKEVEMDTISANGVTINLFRHGTGVTNWDDLVEQAEKSSSADEKEADNSDESQSKGFELKSIRIGGLDINDANLAYYDRLKGANYKLSNLSLKTGALSLDENMAIALDFDAELSTPPLKLDVELDADLRLENQIKIIRLGDLSINAVARGDQIQAGEIDIKLASEAVYDVTEDVLNLQAFDLQVANAKVKGNAVATNVSSAIKVEGEFRVAEFDAKKFLQKISDQNITTAKSDALTQLGFSSSFTANPNNLALKKVKMDLDDSALTGSIDIANFSSPAIGFDLELDKINIDSYLPVESASEKSQQSAAQSSGQSNEQKIDLTVLRQLNLKGTAKVGEFKANKAKLTDVSLNVDAKNGLLKLDGLKANLYDGKFNGAVSIDARPENAKFTVTKTFTDVNIGALLADVNENDSLTGIATIKSDVVTSGNYVSAMKRNLNGGGNLVVKNGALKGFNIGKLLRQAKVFLDGDRSSFAEFGDEENTDFAQMTATMKIANGIVSNGDLLVKAPAFRVKGDGKLDIPADKINYLLNAVIVETSKGQGGKDLESLSGLDIPIRLSGTLNAPSYSLDLEELAKTKASKLLNKEQQKLEKKVKEKLGDELGGAAGNLLKGLFGQ